MVFYLPFDLCLFICLQKGINFFFSPLDYGLHLGFPLIRIPGRYSFLNSNLGKGGFLPYIPVLIIGKPIFHQGLGILPLIVLIIGPSAGQQRHDKRLAVLPQRAYIAVSRIAGKSCLSRQRAIHHIQESIVVIAGEFTVSCHIGKMIILSACDLKEFILFWRFHDAVAHNRGQIPGRCRVGSSIIVSVKPVGRHKICILASDFLRLLVHQSCKCLHGACDSFRNHYCAVIVGLQHQGIQNILQIVLFFSPDPQPDFGLAGRIIGGRHDLSLFHILQGHYARHYLCRAGHRLCLVFILSK